MSLGDFVVGKQFVSNEYIVVMKSIAGGSDFMFMPRESADTESWINLIQTLQAKLTREMFNTQSPMRFTTSSSAETVSLKPRVRDPRRMSVSSLFSSGSSSQNLLLFNSMRQSNESKLEPAMSSSAPSTPSTKKTMTVKEKRTSRFLKSSSTASIPIPIKKPGLVFGIELDKITKLNADLAIPQIVIDTTAFLADKVETNGLFRLSGASTSIQELKQQYDEGKDVTIPAEQDAHVAAGILKLFLREMPTPLLSNHLYHDFVRSQELDETDQKPKIKELVGQLDEINRKTLAHIMCFLHQVAQKAETNLMSADNLGIVISPNILRRNDATMMEIMVESKAGAELTKRLIEWAPEIFA